MPAFNFANYLSEALRMKIAKNQFQQRIDEERRQYDTSFGENQRQFGLTFDEGTRRYDQDYGEDYRRYEKNFDETKRINDRSWQDNQIPAGDFQAFMGAEPMLGGYLPQTGSRQTNPLQGLNDIPPSGMRLLDSIRATEANYPDPWNVMYGGKRFDDFSDHPRQPQPILSGPNKGKYSTAAGGLQIIAPTWDRMKEKMNLPDFRPPNQYRAGWGLALDDYRARTGGSLQDSLESGDPGVLNRIGQALNDTWTSLPGGIEEAGSYGGRTFADLYQSQPLYTSPVHADTSTAVPGAVPRTPIEMMPAHKPYQPPAVTPGGSNRGIGPFGTAKPVTPTVPLQETGGMSWRDYRMPKIPLSQGSYSTQQANALMNAYGMNFDMRNKAATAAREEDTFAFNRTRRPAILDQDQFGMQQNDRTRQGWTKQDAAERLGSSMYELAKQGRFDDIIDGVFKSPYVNELLANPALTHATASLLQEKIDDLQEEIGKESGGFPSLWTVIANAYTSIKDKLMAIDNAPIPEDKKQTLKRLVSLRNMLTGDIRTRDQRLGELTN